MRGTIISYGTTATQRPCPALWTASCYCRASHPRGDGCFRCMERVSETARIRGPAYGGRSATGGSFKATSKVEFRCHESSDGSWHGGSASRAICARGYGGRTHCYH